jgi:hypothetical protein
VHLLAFDEKRGAADEGLGVPNELESGPHRLMSSGDVD